MRAARFSVHVDAGYLYAALATRQTGSSNRAAIRVDEAAMIAAIVALAGEDSGMRLLRVLWYDAAPNGIPTEEQRHIGMVNGVKLRMGRVSHYGEQKGVDLRLGLDLVSLAVNRAVDVAFVVSGDDDLTEAVTDAQDLGLQVKLITVPTVDGGRSLSVASHLALEADGVISLPPAVIGSTVSRTGTTAAGEPSRTGATPNGSPAAGAPAGSPVVPPKQVRGAGPPVVPKPVMTPEPRPEPVYTTVTGAPGDPRELIEATTIEQVARSVFEVWATSATTEERADLLEGRPNIPPQIDRILLTDLVNRTGVDDIPPWARYELRSEFWAVADADGDS